MSHIDPVFFAVVKTGNTHGVVTIAGMQTKKEAEAHAKRILIQGQQVVSIEDNGAAAAQKADAANKSTKPGEGIDASTPANVADVLTPPTDAAKA